VSKSSPRSAAVLSAQGVKTTAAELRLSIGFAPTDGQKLFCLRERIENRAPEATGCAGQHNRIIHLHRKPSRGDRRG
jgi:hypothetical protein